MAEVYSPETIGAYFAWRLQRGETWEKAVADARKKFKDQDPAIYEQARTIAEGMEEAVTRYGGLRATDRLIDAFGSVQPTKMKVGVRFLVWMVQGDGSLERKSIAFDAPVGISIALLEETARHEASLLPSRGSGDRVATRADVGEAPIQLISILTTPLPGRIP